MLIEKAKVQGAYKLLEDFAKPYFHKYWTEIHEVTTTYSHFRQKSLKHVLCDVPDCGVDALSQFW
jgi:hypothetical protein